MQLFISYAREDVKKVAPIVSDLERYFDCWVDWDDIRPGRNWQREITSGVRNCHYCLFFVSTHFLESEWCMKELRLGLWWNKPIMPIVFDPALTLPHALTSRQWVIFSDDHEENLRTILAGLARPHHPWRAIALVEAITLVVGAAILYRIAASG
ncbi:toll/interleukin-1 receptor domain-containing protein [Coleofasciculus sp. F4-SAH-05]|uniref:toll/interleukin-1 receptor domain-containing protein n=1 Tax=Coleofasciculus sp. F4-SAH-05 TaxID=3069525 RepID=UPI0040631B9E